MKGYIFTFGVDGFGADVAPAIEEGVYTNYETAFYHLCELNKPRYKEYYFGKYRESKNIKKICKYMLEEYDEPPIGMYLMQEIEIIN